MLSQLFRRRRTINPPAPPPPGPTGMRFTPEARTYHSNWPVDVVKVREMDGTVDRQPLVLPMWVRFSFPDPPRDLVGEQIFRVAARTTTAVASRPQIVAKVYEAPPVNRRAVLSSFELTSTMTYYTWTWDASLLFDQTGKNLELVLEITGGNPTEIELDVIEAWLQLVPEGTGGAGSELPQPLRVLQPTSTYEFSQMLSSAQPGDHIVLADGTYNLGGQMQLTRSGTAQNPIVIRAQNVLGAKLPGGFNYGIGTAHVWLWGLDFKDARNNLLRGSHHVIRRCRLWPLPNFTADSRAVVPSNGQDCRIDYCEIRLHTLAEVAAQFPGQDWNEGVTYSGISGNTSYAGGNRFDRLIMERCLFKGGINRPNAYARPSTSFMSNHGGIAEDINQGHRHGWIVRLCRVESESGTNIMNHNNSGNQFDRVHVIGNGNGVMKLRYSGWCAIRRCRFENIDTELMGGYHVIENSLITGGGWRVFAGTCAWNDTSALDKFPQAYQMRLSRCAGAVTVGHNWGAAHTFPADGTRIEAHKSGSVTLVSGRHTNTVQTPTTDVPDLEPITLPASAVGPTAPWVGVES